MTSLTQDIKDKLSNLNVLEKIIAVNVVVFILSLIVKPYLGWLALPSGFLDFIVKPWSIVTYAFLHYDTFHILFNMLWLYFLGRMFLNLFSPKIALNIYFLGAISGGLLFMLCYTLFPSVFQMNSSLLGASAAVRALLIFLCAYMPNQAIRFFTFNLKLWYLGLAIVIMDVLGVISGISNPETGNAGGNLAHLGGALLGYYYNSTLKKVINPNHEDVNLTNTQLRIIKILVDNRGEILHVDTIIESAWDKNEVSIFTLRNMIKQIRDKTYYGIIKSHSNKGYSLG